MKSQASQAQHVTGSRSDSAPDAVVIGAGHNGLVAANLLADPAGMSCVCEATEHPGGAVRSAEVTSPGYLSRPVQRVLPAVGGLAGAAGAGAGAVRPALDALAPACWRTSSPTAGCAVLSRDLELTAAGRGVRSGGRGGLAAAHGRAVGEHPRPLIDALFTPFPPLAPGLPLLAGAGQRRTRCGWRGWRCCRFAGWARSGSTERARPLLLAGNALHADLSPDGAGSAIFGWLLAMLGQSVGFPVPIGGAGRLTESMAARLAACGGDRPAGQPGGVDRWSRPAAARRASGWPTGERIRARRAVLADVPAPTLYRDTGRASSTCRPGCVADLAASRWDNPTVKVDWALRAERGRTAPAPHGAGTVHLGADAGRPHPLRARTWPPGRCPSSRSCCSAR